jgi:hypothetical protein
VTTDRQIEELAPLRQRAREQTPLWFAFGGGAAAWFVRLSASYLVVPEVCATGRVFVLHGIALVTLAVAAAAAFVGMRLYREAREKGTSAGDPDDRRERTEFLGLAAAILSAIFAGAIVLESVTNFVIDPCLAGQVR